jgi:tetratricopeptide (TPR) repeat protein
MLSKKEFDELFDALNGADFNRLEELSKKAISNNPKEANAYYFLAEAFYLKKDVVNAEICLAKAIELEPENASFLLRLAKQKELEGDSEDANLLYRKAYSLAPDNSEVAVGLAKYYLFEEQEYDEAHELIDSALKSHSDHAVLLYLKAQAFKLNDEFEDALEYIDLSLQNSKTENALVTKINILLEIGSQESIIDAHSELLEFMGNQGKEFKLNYAAYLIGENIFDKSIEILNSLIDEAEGFNIQLSGMLALAFAGNQNYDKAIELYTQMLDHNSEESQYYISRGEAFQAKADYDAAIKDYKMALSRMQADNQLVINEKLGELYFEQKAYGKAIEQFTQLSKVDWYAKSGFFLLGKAFFAAGKKKEAYDALNKASKLKNREAKQFLSENYSKQLGQIKEKILVKFEKEFDKNKKSAILNNLYGKLCKIDVYKNKFDKNIPKEMVDALRTSLADTFYIFTSKGFFCYNNIDQLSFSSTFRIEDEDEEDVLLDVFGLDKSGTQYQMNVSMEGNNAIIEPQKLKTNTIVLKLIDPTKISNADIKLVNKYASKNDLSFLGNESQDLINKIFGK